ncbi:MAG: hypothetical protein DIU65_05515 [Proteobacteria bacterium]|jgi:hypothetical protein|nr:MAG: hypothetical protein DIU65_05515 [Pseudomonadota bacterium]
MRNLAEKWPVVPDWNTQVLETAALRVRTLVGLHQLLVSGDLAAWSRVSGIEGAGVGATMIASGEKYMARIARDRVLAVSEAALPVKAGWHEEGFAVSVIDAGLHVFELEGRELSDVLSRATTLAPESNTASASVLFAGVNAVLYLFGSRDRARVHVDRGLAPYLWEWLETTSRL